MTYLMEAKWLEMIAAFQKLSPEERVAEAEKRLDEILEKMAVMYHISPQEAYGKLIENRNRMSRQIFRDKKTRGNHQRRSGYSSRYSENNH